MRRALDRVVLVGVGAAIVVSLLPWAWKELRR